VLDDVDVLNQAKPDVELYAPERINWVKQIPGSDEKGGMS